MCQPAVLPYNTGIMALVYCLEHYPGSVVSVTGGEGIRSLSSTP